MKKIFFVLIFLISLSSFAQELSEGQKAKNAGNDAYRSKDYVSAINNWEKYLKSGDEGVASDTLTLQLYNVCFLYAAESFLEKSDFPSACNYYQKYFEKSPKEANADGKTNYNYANALYKINKLDDALRLFQQAINVDYKADYSSFYMASIYKKKGDEGKMQEVLTQAIEKYPDSKLLGKMVSILCNPLLKEAAMPFNQANGLAKEAASGTPEDYIAKMTQACDKFQDAIPLFDKVLKLDPKNQQAITYKKACEDNIKSFNDYKASLKK